MTSVMLSNFGNPSSTHQFGRSSKALLEAARKNIAKWLHCSAQEIVFTSGGTEGDNWIVQAAIETLEIERIITTKVEHHAVLYPIQERAAKQRDLEIVYLSVNQEGNIDFEELEQILAVPKKTLVSLMHVNNETGVETDIEKVGFLCEKYQAYFHSDTVQSMGKMTYDLEKLKVHFLVGSAHKFHGPKGVGFIFVRKNTPFASFLKGGAQEKGWRAGTEPVHQIVGMSEALSIAYQQLDENKKHITALKHAAITKLQEAFPNVLFNGGTTTFYTILNALLPFDEKLTSMILFNLDMKGIAVSRGSACQSGSTKPSHVLAEMLPEPLQKLPSIRISFSKENTFEEVDYLVEVLKSLKV
jgi:cysteine desulfurase